MSRIYHCAEPYRDYYDGVAVYCSDGRFCCHMDEFLQESAEISRYDRVVVPGGPARLAGHTRLETSFPGIREDLGFLITAHHLKRAVLIAHHGCAFYMQALGVPPAEMEEVQKADLVRAARALTDINPRLEVEAYFAHLDDDRVAFEKVSPCSGKVLEPAEDLRRV